MLLWELGRASEVGLSDTDEAVEMWKGSRSFRWQKELCGDGLQAPGFALVVTRQMVGPFAGV